MTRFLIALALLGWITGAARGHAQQPVFVPGSPVTVGRGSGEVILADLDRDGHLDLLTRHLLNRSIAVRLGDGTGRFASAASSVKTFAYQPGAATLGDVNADGILDLAVASKDDESEKVHIFLGDGKGAFDRASGATFVTSVAYKYYKPRVRLVDVDEDGKLDIVTTNDQRNTLEILFGDGRGSFSAATVVTLGSTRGLYTSAVADVDGDGHLDVVAVSSGWSDSGPGRVVTKRGDGRGGFAGAAGSAVTVRAAPRLVAVADVNGDRRADIVLGHSRTGLLSILLNDGTGAFTAVAGSPLDLGMETWAVDVADVDRDGRADLVAATVNGAAAPYDSRIAVLRRDGRGFVPAPGSPFPAGRGAYHLALGDVNEDGALDVAVSSFEGDAVTVLLGRGSPTSP
jgi:hypothetical protein